MAEATIALDRDGDVAVVTLSNPPLNLFADTSFDELMACLDEIEDSGARRSSGAPRGTSSAVAST